MNTQKKIAGQIKKVEDILNISQNTLNTISVDVIDVEDIEDEDSMDIEPIQEILPGTYESSIFGLVDLKKNFKLAQASLQQLINYGQGLMAQTVSMNLEELKASDVGAIAALSEAIYRQLRGLVEIFRDISEIELNIKKLNEKSIGNLPAGASFTQNNYTVTGTTADIIREIKNGK